MGAVQAIPALSFALSSDDPLVVGAAAEALGLIGTPDAFARLIVPLRDRQWTPRRKAATQALETAGEAALPSLLWALDNGKDAQRGNAAELLGWIGDPQAVNGLIFVLDDRVSSVRASAAWALGMIGDPVAIPPLEELWARESNSDVKRQAAIAVARLKMEG
jgi:HEAT repeat protein